jgi:tetratricopeptide (TPR) repeat protein
MSRHKLTIACLLAPLALAAAAGTSAADEPGPRMTDIAARLDYGFYSREPAVVEAARAELEGLSQGNAWREYLLGYAAMRLAELGGGRKGTDDLLDDCIERGQAAAEHGQTALDGWLLVGVCSALAAKLEPVQSLLHQRRYENALGKARAIDSEHPRIRFVESWKQGGGSVVQTTAPVEELEAVAEAFRVWPERYSIPSWGEAEAQAMLGAAYLARDDVRQARDHLEQALLAAPGYRDALELMSRIQTR